MRFNLFFFYGLVFMSLNAVSQNDTLSVIGVGDIMLGTNFPEAKYLPPSNNCSFMLQGVNDILQNADVTFGNFEGVFSDTGRVYKTCKDTTVCYAFRTPVAYAGALKEAGFDMLSLANNHSGDFGPPGRQITINLLDSMGIKHAGLLDFVKTSVFEKDSVKYGLCAVAPNSGTVNIDDTAYIAKLVRDLNSQCDIVLFSFHAGAEGKDHQHVTREPEKFYGEDRGNVYELARLAIDAGADIVFGHGPHVIRALDIYKDRLICYSLGNFCTYRRISVAGVNGIAPIVKVYVDRNGAFIKGQVISVHQSRQYGTLVDPNRRAIKKLKELTLSDIPEAGLMMTNDGTFTFLSKK